MFIQFSSLKYCCTCTALVCPKLSKINSLFTLVMTTSVLFNENKLGLFPALLEAPWLRAESLYVTKRIFQAY